MGATAIALIIGIPLSAIAFIIWAVRYAKAGPNEVLVVSGRKRTKVGPDGKKRTVGYRLVKGGGTFVWPIKERVQRLSLELMTLDVRTPEVYTVTAVPVIVDGVAQVKVKGDEDSMEIAAEEFLSKSQEEIKRTALQTVEGYMRAVIGTMTIEDIYKNRQGFAQKVVEAASRDLAKMGLEIISLTIRNVSDNQGYLEALGKPRIAQVKRDAIIGEAEAEREAKTFRYQAETRIEEARRDHEIQRAEYEAAISRQKAEADMAYDLQKFKIAQQLKREEVQVGIVEKKSMIELQELEAKRREKELEASVMRPADAEKYKIQALAEAERCRLELEAQGEAAAIKAKGFARAEAVRAEGLSEAEIMRNKAEAWSRYNEAAITEMFVNILPKLAQSVSEPLSKTEKIVVIGNGNSAGASKITRDVAEIISQLPPVIESLTGIKLEKLVERAANAGSTVSREGKAQ